MTYTTDIPVSGNTLGGTRDRIRSNFQEIAAVEAINHVAFNAVGKGKHKFLQMPEVTASGAGIPTTLANEGGVYVDVGANPAESNLFFRGESDGFQYQLTKSDQANSATFGTNTAYAVDHLGGWTFLPGGLILQYGTRTNNPNGSTGTITFPKSFSIAVYDIVLSFSRTTGSNSQFVRLEAFNPASLANFQYFNSSNNNLVVTWTAIGK